MTRPAIHALLIASIVTAGLAGCQSGPRWAWWKHETPAADASALAQTSAPVLPSQQASPQTVVAAGLEPAASPSAANLAATQAPADVPALTLPVTSASTIANTPLANYPTTGTAPVPSATNASSAAIASVPPSGPYDPRAFKPSESLSTPPSTAFEQTAGNLERYATAAVDRYAALPASTSIPTTDAPNPVASSVPLAAATTAIDRYATPTTATNDLREMSRFQVGSADPSSSLPSNAFAKSPAQVASQAPPAVTDAGAINPVASNDIAIVPGTTATVNWSSPGGKYRPGGTSDYIITAIPPHVEVATRPAPPQISSPVGASDPWSPPAASTPPSSGAVRTY